MDHASGQSGSRSSVACALGVAALCAACSSSYKPVSSPRASLVLDEGSPHVVRSGVDQGGFSFGGGVVDAVRSNPRALEEARTGRNLTIAGFVVELGGLAVETSGLVYALEKPEQNAGAGLGIALGGVALVIAGTVMFLNGQPHLYDALNIYNDDLDANRPPAYPPGARSFPPAPAFAAPPPGAPAAPALPPPPPPPEN